MVTNEIGNNTSLKNYYVDLHKMYENAIMLLKNINTAFSSYSSNVSFNIDGETYTLPSFLYLDNKINEISNTISTLFNVPNNGDGWFIKEGNSFKLNVLKSNLEPAQPTLSLPAETFDVESNNVFKDLVNPKTYIRIDIGNVASNITEFLMKKVVLHNTDLINSIFNTSGSLSYSQFNELVYLMNEGVDYTMYDSTISRPVKEYAYDSRFEIVEIENTQIAGETSIKTRYTVRLNTIRYYNKNDNSIYYDLKKNDYITLSNAYGIYKIENITTQVDYDNGNDVVYLVDIIEENGHNVLKPISVNSDMYFMVYNNYVNNDTNYLNIPLEENPYIIVFISAVYNGVKSNWSDAIKLDLNNVTIYDNLTKKQISYIEYYNTYCKNIGDIIYSISDIIYPQLVKYDAVQLKELTTGKVMQSLVTDTLAKNDESVLSITAINKHIIDDDISTNLTNLHKQKIELMNNLSNIQANIDSVYNTILSTDFSTEVNVSKSDLNKELNGYYTEKNVIQTQLLSVVDNIDIIKNNVIGYDSLKFRVRGITTITDFDESGTEDPLISYLHSQYGNDCDIIGLEVEYKYKNVNSNSSYVENNTNTLFTDWNRVINIDKQRCLKFSNDNKYTVEYSNYDTNLNIIKWNQIDIPINFGEDVVVRIRYKYNIGQPFINIYTPWSDEVTVSYTEDMLNISDVTSILRQNENDVYRSMIIKQLINDGYQEHITNKVIDNSAVFFHQPENIYSGFYTADNKLVSLKDKLFEITNELNEYKVLIQDVINEEYKVYFVYDDNAVELSNSNINKINITYGQNDVLRFIRKDCKIIIKNTGVNPIKLYSIFPGHTDTPLLHTNTYANVENYERVPLLYASINDIKSSVYLQTLGQWIYFRQNNVYTGENYYNDSAEQNVIDASNFGKTTVNESGETVHTPIYLNYLNISKNNNQQLLIKRDRSKEHTLGSFVNTFHISNGTITNTEYAQTQSNVYTENLYNNEENDTFSKFVYDVPTSGNAFILKYEHFMVDSNTYLSGDDELTKTEILKLMTRNKLNSENDFYGAFFVPELLNSTALQCTTKETNQFKRLDVGESLVIPCCLEYFLPIDQHKSITKTIAFDIRTSNIKPIVNFILSLNIANNISETSQNTMVIPQVATDQV